MPRLASAHQIETALKQVRDQTSFIQELLIRGLGWSVPEAAERIEDLSYGWTQDDLRADGLEHHIVDGNVWQLQSFSGSQPWGIFLLEFTNPDALVTGRGLVGPLRKVLRGLVPSRRKSPDAASWSREHLLFFCTWNYEHFRVAYFKAPEAKTAVAPLATFGWGPDVPLRTACEFNLPPLSWPDDPASTQEWIDQWTSAFDVEKVTRKFYEDYASAFSEVEQMIGHVMILARKNCGCSRRHSSIG